MLRNTVNVWDHMSRVTSQSLEQYIGWSAYGLINTTFRCLGGIPRMVPSALLDASLSSFTYFFSGYVLCFYLLTMTSLTSDKDGTKVKQTTAKTDQTT